MHLKDVWRTILGVGALLIAGLQAVRTFLSWGSEVDFVLARASEPGWIGDLLAFLASPPPFLIIPLIVGGLLLIYWDLRRRGGIVPFKSTPRLKAPLPPLPDTMSRASATKWLEQVVDAVEWPQVSPRDVLNVTEAGLTINSYFTLWDADTGGRATLVVRKAAGERDPVIVVQRVQEHRDKLKETKHPIASARKAVAAYLRQVSTMPRHSDSATTGVRRAKARQPA